MTDTLALGRFVVIGVGLIGGSMARALRDVCSDIVGCGRNPDRLQKAVDLGVIDRFESDVAAAVKDADTVVVAVPVGAMPQVFQAMRPKLPPHAVVTDVGSVKQFVIRAVGEAFGKVPPRFVPGHPIAGTEQSGVEASFAELFYGHRVILTPLADTDPLALQRVRSAWSIAGAEVVQMDAERHDWLLAATSHLPHVLAYCLVDSLARLDRSVDVFEYAAGGFRDFTRIAASDAAMWRDICLANREALLAMLERFRRDLDSLASAIEGGDGGRLMSVFENASDARRALMRRLQPASAGGGSSDVPGGGGG